MCCFSRPIKSVTSTQIFARRLDGDRQALVYSMKVVLDEPLAMVLPLPVVPGRGDDACTFVDLSAYPKFFVDFADAFPDISRQGGFMQAAALRSMPEQNKLVVHEVGDFVASYVPSPKDFSRLDERFQLPKGVIDAHAEYADWGFAVFQLAPHALSEPAPSPPWWAFWRKPLAPGAFDDGRTIHPMAMIFPSRKPDALYFPTLHVHDGAKVPARAKYDHSLYCQSTDERLTKTFAWRKSEKKLGKYVDEKKSKDLVDGEAMAYRYQIFGEQPNLDHWFDPPACKTASLALRGKRFACDLAALSAYHTVFDGDDARARHDTARNRLDELAANLPAKLDALAERHGFGEITGDGECSIGTSLSNWELHHVTNTGFHRAEPGSKGPFVLSIPSESPRVETQNVRFSFPVAPSRDEILALRKELSAVLESSLA